jgi:hypothetical protein
MKNKKFLLAALNKLGVQSEHINEDAILNSITISRRYHNGHRAVRFFKRESDVYTCMYDSDDTQRLNAQVEGQSFTSEVSQWYTALVAKDSLRRQGFMTSIKRVGDKLRVYAQT